MTSTELSALAAVALSLLFSYVPGLNTAYAGLSPVYKRLSMLALLAVVAVGAVAYTCKADTACMAANWQTYLDAFVGAAIANQAAYLISPKTAKVRAVTGA